MITGIIPFKVMKQNIDDYHILFNLKYIIGFYNLS